MCEIGVLTRATDTGYGVPGKDTLDLYDLTLTHSISFLFQSMEKTPKCPYNIFSAKKEARTDTKPRPQATSWEHSESRSGEGRQEDS